MQVVTDPEILKYFNQGASPEGEVSPQDPYAAPTAEPVATPASTGEGSIWNAVKSQMQAQKDAFLAANVTDPELSNYQLKKARESVANLQEERSKLNMAEQFVAGLGGAIPAIGAGMINPLLGGAVAAGMGTADTLVAQLENNQELDMGKALGAGAAMGVADALTGRAASSLKGALPMAKPLTQMGINAAEDVTSNVASQAFENIAANKDWNDGLVEAGMFGAAGGATLRGGLAGLNKAMGYNVNEGGQNAINDVGAMRNDGYNPNPQFQDNVFGFENMMKGMNDDLMKTDLTESGLSNADEIIRRQIDLSINEGGDVATMNAFDIMNNAGLEMIDSAYDIDVSKGMDRSTGNLRNVGEQIGLTKEQMREAGIANQEARAGRFSKSAVDKGLTKEADDLKFQNTYKNKALANALGTFDTNTNYIRDLVYKAEQDGMPSSYVKELKTIAHDLKQVRDMAHAYTGKDRIDVTDSMRITMERLMPLVNKHGLQKDLMNIQGKSGKWNPAVDVMTLDRMESIARARMPNIEQGAPNKYKTPQGGGTSSLLTAGGVLTGNMWLPFAGGALKEYKARSSQKRLGKVKEVGATRLPKLLEEYRNRQNAGVDASLKAGDLGGAAIKSGDILEESGINTAGLDQDVAAARTAPEPEPTPIQSEPIAEPETFSSPRKSSVKEGVKRPGEFIQKRKEEAKEEPKPKSEPKMAPSGKTKDATKKPEPEKVPETEATPTPTVEEPKPKSKVPAKSPKPAPKEEPAPEAPVEPEKPLSKSERRKLRVSARKAKKAAQKAEEAAVEKAPEATAAEVPKKKSEPVPAKKPEAPKKAEEPAVEETKVEPEVEKPKSKITATEPSKSPRQEAPETPVETPEAKPAQPLPQKPKTPEKPSEAESEAPKETPKEEAPKEEPKKRMSFEMARRELLNRKEALEKLAGGRMNSRELAGKIAVVKNQISVLNSETSALSKSLSISKDEVADRIFDMGGIESMMRGADKAGMTTHAYIDMKVRDHIEAEKVAAKKAADDAERILDEQRKKEQAEQNKLDEEQAAKDAEAAEKAEMTEFQRKIASKQNQVRRRLKSLGHPDKRINEAMELSNANQKGVDFDAVEVMNYARTLEKQELQKAKDVADEKAKADSDAAKAAAPKFSDSKRELRTILKGLGMNDHPEVRKMFGQLVRNRKPDGKPLTEAQVTSFMNKVDDIIKAEKEGLEAALKRSQRENPADVAMWRNRVNQMNAAVNQFEKNMAELDKIRESRKDKEETLQMTAKERAQAESDYKRLFNEADKRDDKHKQMIKDLEDLETQTNKFMDDLIEAGVDKGLIQKYTYETFNSLEKPLSGEKLGKAKNAVLEAQKGRDDLAKAKRQKDIDKLQRELGNVLEKVPSTSLERATKPLVQRALKSDSPVEREAIFEATKKSFRNEGMADHVKGMELFQGALERGMKNRELYPDRKDLWLSREDFIDIQNAMNSDSGKAYMGNIGVMLRVYVLGDDDYKPRYSRKELNDKIRDLKAKEAVGDDDIRVGQKATIKKWK